MKESTAYVGLDVHKDSIFVVMRLPEGKVVEWQSPHEPAAVGRLARRLGREAGGPVRCCYEAGPCGYALQRQLRSASLECIVVAPSLIPYKPGDRIKTDRRDARKLAELLQAGLLTEVHPPTPQEESIRDLCRCRDAARKDHVRARQRLCKMLLRRGTIYRNGKKAWTRRYFGWLHTLRFELPTDQVVFEDYLRAVEQADERLSSLDAQLALVAQQDPWREPVGWLRCFHGIDTVTALMIVAELHGFARFRTPRHLMAYLGLVPSEHTSAEKHRRGAITKTGNRHVRRLLVEAAWHYRYRPRIGAGLRKRRLGQPARIIALADKAHTRLYRRHWKLADGRAKPSNVATVAVARELVGFLWAALQRPDQPLIAH